MYRMLPLFLYSLSFLHHCSNIFSILVSFFFVIIALMSAYAFHVHSWTKALDTDLVVAGFVFMPVSCLESIKNQGKIYNKIRCENLYVSSCKRGL